MPPREVFEGPFGYLALFESAWEIAPLLDELGQRWRIAEFSHKPYPAGRATHGGIEGVTALRDQAGFAPNAVEDVRISAPPLIVRLVGRPDVAAPEPSYARLCMAYVVAKVLQHGALDPTHFRGAALADPSTHALAARVRTESDGNPDPNALAPQTVTRAPVRWAQPAVALRNHARQPVPPARPRGAPGQVPPVLAIRCRHSAPRPPGTFDRVGGPAGNHRPTLRDLTALVAT